MNERRRTREQGSERVGGIESGVGENEQYRAVNRERKKERKSDERGSCGKDAQAVGAPRPVIGRREHPPLDVFLAPNPGVASGRRAHIPPHAERIAVRDKS